MGISRQWNYYSSKLHLCLPSLDHDLICNAHCRRWHADPSLADRAGCTALHYACFSKNLQAARLSLQKGCGANWPDTSGKTPLFYAWTPEIVELLVQHGANLGARDNRGWMAHHYHTVHGPLSVVEKLMSIGADMPALTPGGNDALNVAILNGKSKICELLLCVKFPSKVHMQPPRPRLK